MSVIFGSFGGSHKVLRIDGVDKHTKQPFCVRFWAERGLIHWEDSRTNFYDSLKWQEFVSRLKGINDTLVVDKGASKSMSAAEVALRNATQQQVEQGLQIAEQARAQGAPDDASAIRDLARRRPVTVCNPGRLATM